MLNPFFLQGSKNEQGLIQDLINEHLRMFGVEIYYLPRKYLTEKTIIKEVIESKFDEAFPIEAYLVNYEGYGQNTDILTKFGVTISDEVNLIISSERYQLYIEQLIKNDPNIKISSRPKEGDLIFFPLGNRIFEIKFVENEKPFYQLGKNYVYELRCELFEYEDEDIDTDVAEIDTVIENQGYIVTLNLTGIGTTASAITSQVSGGLRNITLINDGQGYVSAPTVVIAPPDSGSGATAVAIMTSRSGLTTALSISNVYITNPGYGYTYAPSIFFLGGGGTGAAATSGITTSGYSVGIITVTNGGSGYTTSPTVIFSSPDNSISYASTARGISVVSAAGTISQIRIINAGIGYTGIPTITISAPSLVGVGTYIYNEIVTGSASSTTAKVRKWTSSSNQLEVSLIDGAFRIGESIIGLESNAQYSIRSYNLNDQIDAYAQNDILESEGDSITDFTESNPFGEVWYVKYIKGLKKCLDIFITKF